MLRRLMKKKLVKPLSISADCNFCEETINAVFFQRCDRRYFYVQEWVFMSHSLCNLHVITAITSYRKNVGLSPTRVLVFDYSSNKASTWSHSWICKWVVWINWQRFRFLNFRMLKRIKIIYFLIHSISSNFLQNPQNPWSSSGASVCCLS